MRLSPLFVRFMTHLSQNPSKYLKLYACSRVQLFRSSSLLWCRSLNFSLILLKKTFEIMFQNKMTFQSYRILVFIEKYNMIFILIKLSCGIWNGKWKWIIQRENAYLYQPNVLYIYGIIQSGNQVIWYWKEHDNAFSMECGNYCH